MRFSKFYEKNAPEWISKKGAFFSDFEKNNSWKNKNGRQDRTPGVYAQIKKKPQYKCIWKKCSQKKLWNGGVQAQPPIRKVEYEAT